MKRLLTLLFFSVVSLALSAQTVCGMTGEGGSVTLTAPVGNVFNSIVFASYGTPNGSCGSFSIGTCDATNSTAIVSAALIGFNSGTIAATNVVFGDPCGGTPKRLYVEAGYTTALPLTLISFSAQKIADGKIKLQWLTADEINTDHFAIEKSTDGLGFEAIGNINAKGKSSNHYDFTSSGTNNAINYYRLKMVDRDGRFTYSNSLRINNNASGAIALSVFPNPAKDAITIGGLTGKGQIRLLDAKGKLFQQISTGALSLTLDISRYAPGIYIIQYVTGKETVSQKWMKQ